MAKVILAWHFLAEAKLANGDHRKVEVGKELSVSLPISICRKGLHGSLRLIDALGYAPGPILCRTEHSGEIQEQEDKLCSSVRKVLWMKDITRELQEWACTEAELAIAARRAEGIEIPVECDAAINAKRLFLQGKITSAQLDAAESAAWSAARYAAESAAESAAWSAAWSAAESAAWSAARYAAESAAESAARYAAESAAWYAAWSAARYAAESAAWYAAWSAARYAAESAARSAAWSAAWSAAESAAESAARYAARSAAWSAAESAQNERLTALIEKLMKEV